MKLVILVFLIMIFLSISVCLYLKNRQVRIQKQKIQNLQTQIEQIKRKASDFDKMCEVIWHSTNTIHLYAALSEENTQIQDLKKNQLEILQSAEKILQLTENDRTEI